jgi:hypothetical protein
MNAEKRKELRLKVQAHQSMPNLRRLLDNAAFKLPAMLPDNYTKFEGIARLMLGGSKMPKRVVRLLRGSYAVKPCVGGVVFTACVFESLGGRENHRLVAPAVRLSDAIAYHFRNSRMRGGELYNLSVEQAAADARVLYDLLEQLAKILVECGVPVMGNPVSEIDWGKVKCDLPREIKYDEYKALEAELDRLKTYVNTLAARITELENQNQLSAPGHICTPMNPVVVEPSTAKPLPEAPQVWCNVKI